MKFSNLSPQSRIWVFISNRLWTAAEAEVLNSRLSDFISGWKAHGTQLIADFQCIGNAIVVLAVDETVAAPSGCSIDKAFRLLTEFGNENGLDFFNRNIVALEQNGKVGLLTKEEAQNQFDAGILMAGTRVYNPLVNSVEEFNGRFVTDFASHWLGKRLFQNS